MCRSKEAVAQPNLPDRELSSHSATRMPQGKLIRCRNSYYRQRHWHWVSS